jgi:hypothetical protein
MIGIEVRGFCVDGLILEKMAPPKNTDEQQNERRALLGLCAN